MMDIDPQDLLITIYLNVCSYFSQQVKKETLRASPNYCPDFTDEEVMTIYIFGIQSGYRTIKQMHQFIYSYWKEWFPALPKYKAYNHRLNFLMALFINFSDSYINIFANKERHPELLVLIDSLPIIMAKGARGLKAKVAKNIATFGYCASKKLYYHGVKLHLFADYVEKSLPNPRLIEVTRTNHFFLK